MSDSDTTWPLYTADQVRELDRLAIEVAGIPGYTLMTRAGEACWRVIEACRPALRALTVFCGAGNNGGDGYVIARLALQAGHTVQLLQLGDPERLPETARQARADYLAAGGEVQRWQAPVSVRGELLVDALLGTGVDRPLEGAWRAAVECINASARPVLAVDIPSGLRADSGAVSGAAVVAQHTVTFIGRKAGLYTANAPDHVGQLHFDDLGVPAAILARVAPHARLLDSPPLGPLAQPRRRSAHKGDFGTVLVIGGDHGMAGAVRLAGEAALRSGAGRVLVATQATHAALIAAACPELMCHGVDGAAALEPLLEAATVVVIGPGLGQGDWGRALLAAVLCSDRPRVVDADALNLLAGETRACDQQLLTPHPGEAARLLQQTTGEIQRDRWGAARNLQHDYGGCVVLKGAGTIIQSAGALPVVCAAGNPGMATAGSGDVLAGVLGALLAQGLDCPQAAQAGVWLHAVAGDVAARDGERGLLARDLIAALRPALRAAGDTHAG